MENNSFLKYFKKVQYKFIEKSDAKSPEKKIKIKILLIRLIFWNSWNKKNYFSSLTYSMTKQTPNTQGKTFSKFLRALYSTLIDKKKLCLKKKKVNIQGLAVQT